MNKKAVTLADEYERIVRDLRRYFFEISKSGKITGDSISTITNRLAPREPPRGMTFEQARALVIDLLDNDSRAIDLLAGLLARGLSGEAAYSELSGKVTSGIVRRRIPYTTRRAIVLADEKLKRDGMSRKSDRNQALSVEYGYPANTIRRITPQLARGRPKKVP
ncbi:hypothetical protein [Paraburkholderia ferrariae]|uniref:Uncharacterized protein n=1 Tax=Paraburkholderia ferrariae TaxID=386056 RepID=A0ABU9RML4_9BURK